ncbi:B-cell differentiation antigen CD72-like [Dendropsophus ebraccatus]|uniref:B-cell differentiation antigen CD72-like n=1 Tax=Dendropsophus ebraccatus TaxID=150705 RepID=UPI0038317523
MADAVTYADLRFAENQRQLKESAECEEDNDQLEVTYENVTLPTRDKEAPTAPPEGTAWTQHLKGRMQRSAPLLALILLIFCFFLLAAATGITIKYIAVSRESQLTSNDRMELSRKLQDHEDRSQEELKRSQEELRSCQEEMRKSQQELKKSQEEMEKSQEELEKSQEELEKSQEELEKSQEELKKSQEKTQEIDTLRFNLDNLQEMNDRAKEELQAAESRLSFIQTELCPEKWTLFGRRCLLFSEYSWSWNHCRTFCEEKESNLLVVKKEDTELKNFLRERNVDYWVGKEVKYWTEWDWPSGYWISDYWICGKVTRAGELDKEDCKHSNKCVCEWNLVQVRGLAQSSPKKSEITLWRNQYKCFMQKP